MFSFRIWVKYNDTNPIHVTQVPTSADIHVNMANVRLCLRENGTN